MLNTICLGYAQGEKCQWINQRQERCRSERKRWLVKPSFHQSGKCFFKILPIRRAIFSFDWKSKRFSVFSKWEGEYHLRRKLMLSRAAGPQICKDATTRKPTQEFAYIFCTLSINKGHNHTGCYSNSGHRHRCTWIMIGLFNKLLPLHLSANVWISLAMGERCQLISACQCHLCISLSWYTSRNASVSFLYWLWHNLLLHS